VNAMPPLAGPTMVDGYIRKKDAARYLGISVRALSNLMHQRKVPFTKLGKRMVRFKLSDLDRAMDRFRTKAVSE